MSRMMAYGTGRDNLQPQSSSKELSGEVQLGFVLDLPPASCVECCAADFSITDDKYPEVTSNYDLRVIFAYGLWYYYDAQDQGQPLREYVEDPADPYGNVDFTVPRMPNPYPGFFSDRRQLEQHQYLTLFDPWDTRITPSLPGYAPPIGTNGPHTIQLKYIWNTMWPPVQAYEHLPISILSMWPGTIDPNDQYVWCYPSMAVGVTNLTITNVHSSNGGANAVDYLKYDPDSTDPLLTDPTITFTI